MHARIQIDTRMRICVRTYFITNFVCVCVCYPFFFSSLFVSIFEYPPQTCLFIFRFQTFMLKMKYSDTIQDVRNHLDKIRLVFLFVWFSLICNIGDVNIDNHDTNVLCSQTVIFSEICSFSFP